LTSCRYNNTSPWHKSYLALHEHLHLALHQLIQQQEHQLIQQQEHQLIQQQEHQLIQQQEHQLIQQQEHQIQETQPVKRWCHLGTAAPRVRTTLVTARYHIIHWCIPTTLRSNQSM